MSWNLQANLAGVQARSGPGGYVEPTTGAYRVKITGTEAYEKEGRQSVKFQTVIDEGDFAGTEMRLFIGADLSKVGNQRSWKTALVSVGVPAASIENGLINIGEETFKNKTAYVYFKAKDPNDQTSQSDKQFITPEAYANLSGSAKPAAQVQAAPTMTVAPAPAGGSKLRGMLQK